jgi:class 3 adenylate cyclase
MNRFTLAFDDPALEKEYLASRKRRWRTFAIGALSYGLVIQPLLTWSAARLMPEHRALLLRINGFLLFPVIALGVAAPLLVPARHRSRAVLFVGPVTYALVMLYPIILIGRIGAPAAWYTSMGVALTVGVFSTGLGLRFVHGLWVTSAVVAAYLATMVTYGRVGSGVLGHAVLWLVTAQVFSMQQGYAEERSRRRAFLQQRTINEERAKSDRLLRNMLPEAIADRLKREPGAIADHFDAVTVLFADIVGFTPMSERLPPSRLILLLNSVFSAFDELARRHGLEKIKTIGDAYMVVSGVPVPRVDHASAVAAMALEMRDAAGQFGEGGLALRIGLHSGPAVAGVIGTAKYSYDLWGDTVNTASRMESHGAAGEIHVSEACRAALDGSFVMEERGLVEIKGKGPMRTWWLKGRVAAASNGTGVQPSHSSSTPTGAA